MNSKNQIQHQWLAQKIEELTERLSPEDKVKLVVGKIADGGSLVGITHYLVPGAAGTTEPMERYGLPAIVMTDGPAGVRITPVRENDSATYYATGFPIATLLAATWNTSLVEEVGKAIGEEAKAYGSDIQLAPAMNIMRNPLCGRNFEYYSEDPVITGKMGAAMVNGLQANGMKATPKHFAANNNETNRMSINVHASPRTLREIYLRGFEIMVRESAPSCIMTSYNLLNGIPTSANKELLTTLLREEWGFDGMVMTDWYGGYNPETLMSGEFAGIVSRQLAAGNDLIMPGMEIQIRELMADLDSGKLTMETLNRNVRRVLGEILTSNKMKPEKHDNRPDLESHARLTRQAACEGMVLLKNENRVLPISDAIKNVAAFGCTSYNFIAGGTGSGHVFRAYTVSLAQGIQNAGLEMDKDLCELYTPFIEEDVAAIAEEMKQNPYAPPRQLREMDIPEETVIKKAKTADMAFITIGRTTGEFADRPLEGDFTLTNDEMQLIQKVSKAFHAENKKVIVVLNVGGVIETASWRDLADAVLLAWQPGQEGGNSVMDVITGKENPSGRLTVTFPMHYEDTPSASDFPGKPVENPVEVSYKEGVYVGYRYFHNFHVKPAYEFGYGLSYTETEFSGLKIQGDSFEGNLLFSVEVKNTGNKPGKEVVQIYLTSPQGEVDKPERVLKTFAKTRLLQPEETQTIDFCLSPRDIAYFHPSRSAWIADAGQYKIEAGISAAEIRREGFFRLPETLVVEKVNPILANDADFRDLCRRNRQ